MDDDCLVQIFYRYDLFLPVLFIRQVTAASIYLPESINLFYGINLLRAFLFFRENWPQACAVRSVHYT